MKRGPQRPPGRWGDEVKKEKREILIAGSPASERFSEKNLAAGPIDSARGGAMKRGPQRPLGAGETKEGSD